MINKRNVKNKLLLEKRYIDIYDKFVHSYTHITLNKWVNKMEDNNLLYTNNIYPGTYKTRKKQIQTLLVLMVVFRDLIL